MNVYFHILHVIALLNIRFLITSAFFWLLSILLSSAIWYVVKPVQTLNPVTIAYSVLLQELFRWLYYKLVR